MKRSGPAPTSAASHDQRGGRKPADASEDERIYAKIRASGLFDPAVYLSLNDDVRMSGLNPWDHFRLHGLTEGRNFTNAEIVARALIRLKRELINARDNYLEEAAAALDEEWFAPAARLAKAGPRIGVFLNEHGNFFMEAIADMLVAGLRYAGLEVIRRNEKADKAEPFDLRIFVAPHEFFILGEGVLWAPLASEPNSVLYNVEQVQTPWFCRAIPFIFQAPLVIDLNFQSAEILRQAGVNVVHFAPGYLPENRYTSPAIDVSGIELTKGYAFSDAPFDWTEDDVLASRPIDVLFLGTQAERRTAALERLRGLADRHRFLCVYPSNEVPLTARNYTHASTQVGCALGQRAKIVLNIHRDWLGYFEWSRVVLQGIWQGACVVSDPGLPDPTFEAGVHFLAEDTGHMRELIEWLLGSEDGRATLDATRRAGFERARTLGSMRITLRPLLRALENLFAARLNPAPARAASSARRTQATPAGGMAAR